MNNRRLNKMIKKRELAKQEILRDNHISEEQFNRLLAERQEAIAINKEIHRIQNKISNKKIMKLGKHILKTGSVVKLYTEDEMGEKYDPQLKRLVDDGHRFVIGIHFGIKSNSVPIHLLSTSKKANQYYRNGCKLNGNYTNFNKDVYIDTNTIWFIKRNCIKSYEYQLDALDQNTLEYYIFADRNFAQVECKLGITTSGILDDELTDYKFILTRICADTEKLDNDYREQYRQNLYETFGTYNKCKYIVSLYGMPNHKDKVEYDIAKSILDMSAFIEDVQEKNLFIEKHLDEMAADIPDELIQIHDINLHRGYEYIPFDKYLNSMDKEDQLRYKELVEVRDDNLEEVATAVQNIFKANVGNDMTDEDKDAHLKFIKEDILKGKDSCILEILKQNSLKGGIDN